MRISTMDNHRFTKWKTVLTTVLFHIICQTNFVEAIRFESLPFYLNPQSIVIQSEGNLVSPSQVFGFCRKVAHKNTDYLCNIYMETSKNIGSRDHVRECAYILKPFQTFGSKRLIAIDNDKAVLRVTSEFTTINILDFSDCSIIPVKITTSPLKIRYANVYAPHGGIFDLIVYGQGEFCEGRGACRYISDFHGNIVMGNEYKWITDSDKNFKAMVHSREKGRLVVEVDERRARVKAINDYGRVTVLKEYPVDQPKDSQGSRVSASATHGLISVCSLMNSTIMCSQFNSTSVHIFEATFQLDASRDYHSIRVHNLPDGGLLILVFECTSFDSSDCDRMQRDFVLHKIDASGVRTGSLKIAELCVNEQFQDDVRFFVSEEKAMCLSVMCDTFLINDQLSLDLICFKDEDLNS